MEHFDMLIYQIGTEIDLILSSFWNENDRIDYKMTVVIDFEYANSLFAFTIKSVHVSAIGNSLVIKVLKSKAIK